MSVQFGLHKSVVQVSMRYRQFPAKEGNILRIALVECSGLDRLNIYALIKMSRGIPLLAAILKEEGHEVTCYVESVQRFNWQELMNYDLVGFSAITCTANPTYEMIGQLRSAGYKKAIVVGGPHPTKLPEESLLAGADVVVRHEGDRTFLQLAGAMHSGGSLEDILGITWKNGNLVRHNTDQILLTEEELSALPLPAFDTIVGYEKMEQTSFNCSRGCPSKCRFCAVAAMFGVEYRASTVEARIAWLREYKERYPVLWQENVIFFSDDNFFGSLRTKVITVEFLKQMVAQDLVPPKGWLCQARVTDITPEIAELMKLAGCDTVCLGIESADAVTLKKMRKGQNPEQIRSCLATLNVAGIKSLAMTIAGVDTDTAWSFFRGIRQLWRWGITYLQILGLVLLPGTEIEDDFESEGREWLRDYDLYNGQHVLFRPKKMSRFGAWLCLYAIPIWFYFLTSHGRGLIKKHWKSYRGILWIAFKQSLSRFGRTIKDRFVH